jgi:hypothetical protein
MPGSLELTVETFDKTAEIVGCLREHFAELEEFLKG